MIIPTDYNTEHLQPGQTIKTVHKNCSVSASPALRITYKPEGIWYYCHACKEYFLDKDQCRLLSHVKQLTAQAEAYRDMKRSESLSLPKDFSHTIGAPGLVWLASGGWGPHLIKKYNVGWSESLGRVIFPLKIGWVGRYVFNKKDPNLSHLRQEKYLQKGDISHVWFDKHSIGSEHLYSNSPGGCAGATIVVLVEDILSGGRVGEFINCCTLLGTTADATQYIKYDKVLVWLDPDAAGESGTRKIVKNLRWYTDVQEINSAVDPKKLTNMQIKQKLQEALC